MKNLKFYYAKAQDILCFGPQGVEFHFSDFGNIVQIRGINLDYPGTDDDPASNASGKSSIQELLSIGLFGKTVKNPKKLKGGSFINTLADKGEVEVQWDQYRVVRTFRRSPSGSVTSKIRFWESEDRIWDDESEKTKGKSAETQKLIEEQIGLSHHAFCNVVIFDDSNSYSFLESDGPTKREFVENLLGLDQYREYHSNAKDYLKEQKTLVERLSGEYESLQRQKEEATQRITRYKETESQWKEGKKTELKTLMAQIKTKEASLVEVIDTTDGMAAWEASRQRIEELRTEIEKKQNQKVRVDKAVTVGREKVQEIRDGRGAVEEEIQSHVLALRAVEADLEKHLKLIQNLENLKEGTQCPTCHGVISSENYGAVLQHSRNTAEGCRASIDNEKLEVEKSRTKLQEKLAAINDVEGKITAAEEGITKVEREIRQMQSELTQLSNMTKPDADAQKKVIETEIAGLKKQFNEKRAEFEGDSPYKDIISQSQQEVENKDTELQAKGKDLKKEEKELPYYQFWVEAFGDKGIRKYVVDGIIPALNTRIAYWMQYLIDNKIELTFDNQLEVTITRNGNDVDYYSTSNGERRRINLAVSQAFAYVMMLNSGSCPSLVFLDEITGGGIDRAGVVGVYNMIFELAKERQVFVTTHNENLISMLQGCEEIRLQKQNDITVLV